MRFLSTNGKYIGRSLIIGALSIGFLVLAFGVPTSKANASLSAAPQRAISTAAHWIWNSSSAQDQWVAFRKSFSLSSVPGSAIAQIAADTHYWMWVNGTLVVFEGGVLRGPNPNDTYYDEVDIADYLQTGTNTIAIQAWYIGRVGGNTTTSTYNPSGQGGLIFQAVVGSTTINSDNTWKMKVFPGYSHSTASPMPQYLPVWNIYYDARNATSMANWTSAGFDDSSWGAATDKGAAGTSPWNALLPRTIPLYKFSGLRDYTNAASLPTTGTGGNITANLPSNIQVTPYLHVNASAGQVITIQTDHYGGQEGNPMRVNYTTVAGEQEFEGLAWMSGGAVIYNIPSGVTILGLKYRESGYDTELAGSFTSNDTFYNKLWTEAVRTVYVNMRDTFFDCPTRERALWWGDAAVDVRGLVYAFDPKSYALVDKSINQLIAWRKSNGVLHSPIPGPANRELPPQMLVTILELWDYYLQTGNASALNNTTYQAIKTYMNLWTFDSQGLINHRAGDWDWNDWGSNMDKRIMDNAWYYMALESTINLANLTGNGGDVASWQTKRNSIANNFNTVLWNNTNHEYRSPGYTGDTDDRGNALAVVAGLASPSNYSYITTVLNNHRNASPYTEVWPIEALYLMNQPAAALNRLRTRYTTEVNDNQYTLWEQWGSGTSNHGWNGAPFALSRYGLGARATSPGWTNYDLLPMLGSLTSINAVVPTVKGNLTVNISAGNTSNYSMSVASPGGTTGYIGVPKLNSNPSITANGTNVFQDGSPTGSVSGLAYQSNDGSYVYFNANPGTWNFVVTSGGGITPTTPTNTRTSTLTLTRTPTVTGTATEITLTRTPTRTSTLTSTGTGGITWTQCASENGTCTVPSTMVVRYGANTSWFYRVVTGSIACNNSTWGDPISGMAKACYYSPDGPTPTGGTGATNTRTPTRTRTSTRTTTGTGGITWTQCASENGTCTFTGTMTVRYGAGSSWYYRVATGSIACNNATFGDPIQGTAKACYYSPDGPTPTP